MDPQEFSDLLASRRTTRDFKTEPIPPATVEAILQDARDCASWSNTRPYMVAVASGERLERLRHDYVSAFNRSLGVQHKDVKAIVKAPFTGGIPDGDFKAWKPYPKDLLPRSREVGKGLYEHMGIPRGDQEARDEASRRNLEFFGAPLAMWFFVHKKLLPFSAQDVGILFQTVLLSAKVRGVGLT